MSWTCKNEDCGRCFIKESAVTEVISFDKDGNKVNSAERCPRCGSKRIDDTKWDGTAPSIHGHNVANSYSA